MRTARLDDSCNHSKPPPPVTLANRHEFADRLTRWVLDESIRVQFEPFARGFTRLCDSPILGSLEPEELEAIVCGGRDYDFGHLRAGARYEGFNPNEPYIADLWEVLLCLDERSKKQFLRFATGSDLVPLGGLGPLKLKIQKNGAEPVNHLPTAHTCFNLLLLPHYESKDKLRRLLLMAIENAEGFGLE
eukprot:gnl/TRDRNA2_/TRDRNA2_168681_c0_seq1.p1 gnl/TRDRNA2_/TRDRNA2_168681_c0~~gnl/TRDRNA2_/TRDRNA2_168681_c0_seq1.p1  ORF type:complete len:189 (+),score=38.47 gnl/TRDRNA2_/TRDRNA2_168681_c0_seq1:313-879(+)